MKSGSPGAIIVLLLQLTSVQISTQQDILTRCRNALDIVIAVDGSNSMGEPNFRLQINSVANMVNNLDVSQNNVHVGAILYSQEVDSPPIPITFNKPQTVQGIQGWQYPDTETRTDLAIDEAMDMFQRDGRGGNVPQVLIIITDGASTIPARTLASANEAKRRGIQVFAVGVSGARNEIDLNELRAVASSPDMALVTPDFRTLENTLNNAAEQICVSLACGRAQIDMVFMLDTSSTVGASNFQRLKEFVVEFLFYAHIHVGNIRVGVMTYSDAPMMHFNMLSYIGNENGLNQAVRAIQYRPGRTNMASAFQFVREQMFTVANGDRQAAPDVVIMVSGSLANVNMAQTVSEAEATRAAGIQVYGLGVGLPNTRDLDGVTSRPVVNNRFTVPSYDQLQSIIQPIYSNFNRFCALPPPVPACFMGQTDLWYVVDLSLTAERLSRFDFTNDFNRLKNGLTQQINIAMDPSVANPGVRMGLVSFSDQAQRVVSPSEQASVSRTAGAVNALPGFIRVSGSNIVRALQQITSPPQQSRWNSYVAMVTPQSALNNIPPVQNELSRLRQLGYTIVFFTVQDGSSLVSPGQVANLASGPQYFYYLQNYQLLEEATKNFTRDILCAAPPPFIPTVPVPAPVPIRGNGLCAPTRYRQNGMDVVSHPRDCDKYVQCYYNQDTNMDLAIVRSCPMGLHWLQTRRQCVSPREANCPTDMCLEDCDAYKTEGACGAYWECNGRRSEFKCCRPMFAFKPGKGCKFDPTCQDMCEPKNWCGLCLKRPNYRMPYGYDVMSAPAIGNQGNQMTPRWSPRHCDYSYFDIVTCDCTREMSSVCPPDRSYNFRDGALVQRIQSGAVDGVRVKDMNPTATGLSLGPTSELHVDADKGKKGEPFTIMLRFTEGQAFSPYGQVLLTSGMNCGEKRGLVVNADDRFITAEAYSRDGQKVMVSVPYQGIQPTEFKSLGISYARGWLTLSVMGRNQQYIAQSKAPVDICIACGIDVGATLNKQSLTSGQIESISVYSCETQSFSG